MEFCCKPSALLVGLRRINPAADESTQRTTELNAQVRLRVVGQRLELLTHDRVVQARTWMDVTGWEDGAFCVPVRLLEAALEVAPEVDVKAMCNGGRLELAAPGYRRSIIAMPGERMSNIPEMPAVTFALKVDLFEKLLKWTDHSAGVDETRPDLACVVLDAAGKTLRATASDGKRAARASVEVAEGVSGKFVIHHRALRELRRLVGMHREDLMHVTQNEQRIFFRTGETTVAVLPVMVGPSSLDVLFGQSRPSCCVVESRRLIRMLKGVSDFSGSSTIIISLGEAGMTIQSTGPNCGDTEDLIGGVHTGTESRVALNGEMLRVAVNALGSDKVNITAGDGIQDVIVRPADGTDAEVVIAPMHLP